MNIQLKEWKVKNLSFKINDIQIEKKTKKNSFNLSMGHFFSEENSKEFGIGFRINIKDEEFNILMEMVFLFELDEDVDEKFKQSDFLTINAPAIAFPYVRSYISNLTLQSGFSPIILPSVNFVKLAKKISNK
ncbi:protein-export chaperone SecB [Parabacteroides distasonis]|jgi:preprotein translocase subunit SecB|uniref:Protein-export chaperone SecB n=2 Tax=Parabacteroides TaxID=375288 RepID=A0AAW6F5Z3_PARDI|nr:MULTISPECIES: protein-export chaperone SecB [Bacteroidales]MDB9138930.1 protein-export chaperone SecB [Parabacteroides distasonis]MDB9145433.1 protein-export chaperone SecB [Parabacteroides distasonis]RGT11969.1 preprotein translocase subunit SecB [Bacteroides uniformis]RHC90305.1 preprotein translocase subunit SecB [Parabacteroides merdae]RHE02016.1 preprotein translocase subunit SecB [Bacteroides uniformis]